MDNFPALTKYNDLIFCDNAGGSQLPIHVIESLNKYITNNYVQPIGNNFLSNDTNKILKNVKNIVNILLNNIKGEIIFGSSCTQLAYNLANSMEDFLNIDKGEIILTNFSHEACITPFERIAKKHNLCIKWWSTIEDENNKYKIDYNELFNMINNNTKLVVLPHVSNILGNVIDITHLIKKIKEKNSNIKVLVDGVAYMPHGLIDVNKYDVDYYIVSFYKFCGLRISVLYCLDSNLINIKNQNHYFFDNINTNFSKKLELGGYNYECASSIIGLRNYLIDYARFFNYNNFKDTNNDINNIINNDINNEINNEINFDRELLLFVMEKIYNHEKAFVDIFKSNINNMSNVEIIECKETEKIPIFSLKFHDYNENNLNLLLNNLGILTSNGTFYCNRFFDLNNIDKISGVLRISLMHYNTIDECNKIINVLKLFKKQKMTFNFSINSILKNNVSDHLKNSFNNINIDSYYKNKRLRAYSLLNVMNINNISIIGDIGFYQSNKYNKYNGNILRNYSNISNDILNDTSFKFLVNKFKEIASKNMNCIIDYIQIHQIRVYGNENNVNLVPEGIHQDGYNIIGMVCIMRKNIKGAISNIYDNNKDEIYNIELQEGELLILNDNKLYHDVTNIELINKDFQGYRDIFVFTTIS